jgi:integrase
MASIEKRTSHDGNNTYRVKVRLKGFPSQTATFNRLTDARKWAQSTESAIREGRHFKTAEAKRRIVSEMIDRYIKDVLPTKPKQINDQTYQLTWWKEQIGQYSLAEVSPPILVECRDSLLRSRSPATVVRYMAALSHVFTTAVNEWQWLEDSPMRKVKKPREPRGRVRFLTDEERPRLLQACKDSKNKYLYTCVVIALSTGVRKQELMQLKWSDLELDKGYLILHETKNGNRRRVPITGHAMDSLKQHAKIRRINTDLVFPGKDPSKPIDIRTAFENALENAGISDFRWHDLRHSTASYLAMNGASLAEIAEVLGHKTLAMVKRYAHLTDDHVSSVVTSMNSKIFSEI